MLTLRTALRKDNSQRAGVFADSEKYPEEKRDFEKPENHLSFDK
jgi:hypothetical protein